MYIIGTWLLIHKRKSPVSFINLVTVNLLSWLSSCWQVEETDKANNNNSWFTKQPNLRQECPFPQVRRTARTWRGAEIKANTATLSSGPTCVASRVTSSSVVGPAPSRAPPLPLPWGAPLGRCFFLQKHPLPGALLPSPAPSSRHPHRASSSTSLWGKVIVEFPATSHATTEETQAKLKDCHEALMLLFPLRRMEYWSAWLSFKDFTSSW